MLYMYMDPCTVTLVYVYSCRFNRFYAATLMSILSLLFIVIWPAAGGDTVCIYTLLLHTTLTGVPHTLPKLAICYCILY